MSSDKFEDHLDVTTILRVAKIGNSFGLVLPEALLTQLNLKEGDNLHLEQCEQGFKLTPFDSTHAQGLQIARQAFHEYAETFEALAK